MGITLTTQGEIDLKRRIALGEQALNLTDENDNGTRARDIIAHVLTAVLGPAGHCDDGRVVLNDETLFAGKQLLDEAFDSWRFDAEDYDLAE